MSPTPYYELGLIRRGDSLDLEEQVITQQRRHLYSGNGWQVPVFDELLSNRSERCDVRSVLKENRHFYDPGKVKTNCLQRGFKVEHDLPSLLLKVVCPYQRAVLS